MERLKSCNFVQHFGRAHPHSLTAKRSFVTITAMATREHILDAPAQAQVLEQTQRIVLWNDDVNTFDWVIECLVKVCEHTPEQAEQCAWFVHFKGKYAVKHGAFDDLRPVCEALLDRGLTATVE